ncbi:hypothetical protein LB504_010016, partial [Fusarium proliferatum]
MPVLRNSVCLPRIPVGVKVSWALALELNRLEDVAYFLLGIFDINMYLMPFTFQEGEKSTDLSLFAWKAKSDREASKQRFKGVLALKPSEFSHCQDVLAYHDYLDPNSEYSMTNKRLRMEAKLGLIEDPGYLLALNFVTCTGKYLSSPLEWIGIVAGAFLQLVRELCF